MIRRPLSLKARALAALARREHSRLELRRKLAPHAESSERVEQLLDALEAAHLLSAERFAESLVHRRGDRYGTVRVAHELRSHNLPAELVAQEVRQLRESEYERARVVWARKFGRPPADLAERLRHMRFLAARGFAADVICRVVGGDEDSC